MATVADIVGADIRGNARHDRSPPARSRVARTTSLIASVSAAPGSVDPDDGFAMVFEAVAGSLGTPGALAKVTTAPVLASDPYRNGEAIVWEVVYWLAAIGVW